MPVNDRIQLRRGTEAQWIAAEAADADDEPLADGEPGVVVDADGVPLYLVVGDTGTEFEDLPRFSPDSALSGAFAPLAAGIEGTGMPEGVVAAPVGTVYRDLAATNGAVVWVKATGTGTTGWRVMWGDTGLRNIDSLISAPNLTVIQAHLHRVGSVVSLSLGVTTSEGWASDTSIATIPAGFRLVGSLTRFLPPGYSSTNLARLTAAGDLRLYGSSTGQSRWEWQWLTADAWPTTLPGTAV